MLSWRPTPPPPVLPWQLAHEREDRLALAERALHDLLRGLERPGVQQHPQREQTHHRHGPPRDLLALLGRGDVGRVRAWRRRGRGSRRARPGRAGPRRPPARGWTRRPSPAPRCRPRPAPASGDASSPPPSVGSPSAARRSRDRLRRCSGISVTTVLSTLDDASRAGTLERRRAWSAIFRTGRALTASRRRRRRHSDRSRPACGPPEVAC